MRTDVLVVGLPRGVPVAFEVARALHAPLDVIVLRKLGVSGHEELAMGAIASGVRVVTRRWWTACVFRQASLIDVDAVHIHNLGDFDMARVFTTAGALGGLQEGRKQGVLRYIGTSGHMRPARFVRAIETGEIDFCMNALNFADRNTYDFEGWSSRRLGRRTSA